MIYYRIHPSAEDPSTALDPERPDGWVASDESYETQPLGTSATESLNDLASYVSLYSLNVLPGDLILKLDGHLSPEPDRDQFAVRVIVESYEVLGFASDWQDAYEYGIDDIIDLMDGDETLPEEHAQWLSHRLDEGWLYDFDPNDREDVREFVEGARK